MAKVIDIIKVDPTGKIDVEENDEKALEAELNEMTEEALLRRLKFEETDTKVIKMIKKILKTKK